MKQERGQFFTPRNVIDLMVQMMDPGEQDLVLDPACGSGGFLVRALEHVRYRKVARVSTGMNRRLVANPPKAGF